MAINHELAKPLLGLGFGLRHIKNQVINFAPSNKSIMANKLPLTNLERFL